MNEERPKLTISSFRDAGKTLPISARMLPRHKPHPGREMPVPLVNSAPSPTAAKIAVAVFGSTPLIFASRRQVSLERKTFSIHLSNQAIAWSRARKQA